MAESILTWTELFYASHVIGMCSYNLHVYFNRIYMDIYSYYWKIYTKLLKKTQKYKQQTKINIKSIHFWQGSFLNTEIDKFECKLYTK